MGRLIARPILGPLANRLILPPKLGRAMIRDHFQTVGEPARHFRVRTVHARRQEVAPIVRSAMAGRKNAKESNRPCNRRPWWRYAR